MHCLALEIPAMTASCVLRQAANADRRPIWEGTLGFLRFFRAPAADPRRRRAGRVHRRAVCVPDAKRHLRIFPRPRRTLCQGAVPRNGIPRRPSRNRAGAPIRSGLRWWRRWSRACCALCRRPATSNSKRCSALVLSIFDRYPVPAALGAGLARGARRACAPVAAHRPASAEARHGHRGALGGNLFRPDADPREAARKRFPDHAQLSAGDAHATSTTN